ncbi:MAG: MOSC domain-containing protein [Halothiobacillaceae bacterium]|nr:MAG: MOSC domain-containing protein [Halothiobacillaceae bacterium]
MTNLIVSELAIYPVKSLAPLSLRQSTVEAFGLTHDRRWMVVDPSGKFLTQRQLASMCLIQPSLTNGALTLTAPGMEIIAIPPATSPAIAVQIWSDHCRGLDCGDAAAQWLHTFLDRPCRLVYFPDEEVRPVDPNFALPHDKTAFSDGFPLLLTTTASLDYLNSYMVKPIAMQRFRPNIVISGNRAFDEDQWQRLRIGDTTYRVAKPCSRCVIPNIDPTTATIEREPTQTLLAHRKRDNKVYFGQNLIADGDGVIAVGMEVERLA